LDVKRFYTQKSGVPCSTVPIWRIDPQYPESQTINRAGKILDQGGVIVYPTETFYGLGGNPTLQQAVERIYRIKGRAFDKPLPLIASNLEAVYRVVAEWPKSAERLAQTFWPGPLTLILGAAPSLVPRVHAGTGRIAIRISSHPVSQALASEIGGLLIATSANRSGQQAYRIPMEIPEGLLAEVDGLIDAGSTGEAFANLASTIVDLSSAAPRLIRPGCIPWEQVEEVLSAGC